MGSVMEVWNGAEGKTGWYLLRTEHPADQKRKKYWSEKGIKQTELAALLQLENVVMTREALVKIERGVQHIKATQLKAIKEILDTSYDEIFK